jgi:ubiquitin-conjugating enzyme E2 S
MYHSSLTTLNRSSQADNLSSKSLRRINKELNALRAQPPEGIRILINEDDITDLKAWIHGPAETPYHSQSLMTYHSSDSIII